GWPAHTAGTAQNTGGRCTQQGQFRTRVVGAHSGDSSEHGWSGAHRGDSSEHGWSGAHSGDSSEHGWSVHTAGSVQNTGGRCTQRTQFRTQVVSAHNRDSSAHSRVVQACSRAVHNPGGLRAQEGQPRTRVASAHSRDSSKHGWPAHTAGPVQNTGGQCTHSGASSEHGWSVRTAGTVQDTGGQCAQQGQFRTLTVSTLQTLSSRRLQTGATSGWRSRDNQRSAVAPRALSS
ncbi:unnamed protein product, partial [Staurois parvus]